MARQAVKVRVKAVRVSNAKLATLYLPTGHIGGFANKLTATAFNIARRDAPKRSGRLRDSIFVTMPKSSNTGVHLSVNAGGVKAYYAIYPENGSTGPIWGSSPLGGMRLYSPKGPYGNRERDAQVAGYGDWVGQRVLAVRPQEAQHFLRNAGLKAAARHLR